ncbi:MAG TPA: PLP-dependent aminotransferase family protein [Gemmatimonadaceae bacterium]|jgi:GntR family transcriptional regulator/MocR family aminotransferase|nr:PLP-dependent aminotransferase family protein [Gemmatimonadaceae bacterium]
MRTAGSTPLIAHLPIDRRSGVPLHRQVYDGLRNAILGGMLRPGQRVPSTRSLAAELGMSRLPVLTAYDQLLHEGYLEGHTGSGTYVCAAPPDTRLAASAPQRLVARPGRKAPNARRVAPGRDEGGIRPFRMSLPALDEFPLTLWNRIVARHSHRMSPSQMAYGDPAGIGALRDAIAEHLRVARAVRCEAEQVLVTAGSQPGLRLCAAVLLEPGDRIAVEEPGYPGARAAFTAAGAELLTVPVDDEGIDVGALASLRQRVRAVYVTPSHQYPLGASMTANRRLALLDWAARHGAWIIEDDYDSEYRYVSRPLGALQGMDARGRVVYVGTFSKVLFPALRVGYLVVPPALWDAFLDARDALDVFSPTLYQLALAEFIRDGHFARHLRRMRGVYLKRREALLAGIERYCADALTVVNADAGLHVATLLTNGAHDATVLRRMREEGLTAMSLSSCYIAPPRRQGLLLGFGGFDERALSLAARTLGTILEG